jgi:hypothetical protein
VIEDARQRVNGVVVGSPAGRRALIWCLCVGLYAVALGVIELKSASLAQWSAGTGLSFWELAAVVVLDAVLVVIGMRGSGAFRMVARTVFWFVFAVAVLYGVVGGVVRLLMGYPDFKGPEFSWSELLLGELIFVPTGALQLVSLKAVPKTGVGIGGSGASS